MLTDEVRGRMARLADALRTSANWTPEPLTADLRAFAAAEGVGLGKIGPWLRGVLSGGAPAPDLAGALTALGRGGKPGPDRRTLFRTCGERL